MMARKNSFVRTSNQIMSQSCLLKYHRRILFKAVLAKIYDSLFAFIVRIKYHVNCEI